MNFFHDDFFIYFFYYNGQNVENINIEKKCTRYLFLVG